jgi:hypothetical protein
MTHVFLQTSIPNGLLFYFNMWWVGKRAVQTPIIFFEPKTRLIGLLLYSGFNEKAKPKWYIIDIAEIG